VRLKRGESAFFVNAHQPAIAGDVGRADGGQPPLDARFCHAAGQFFHRRAEN